MSITKLTKSELDDALLSAANNGEIDKVKELISKGVDVNTKNSVGSTALHEASFSGYIEIAQLLIENGADINAKNDFGNTALHKASWNGHIKISQLLINHGADIHAKDKEGRTAEDIAREFGCENTAEFLKNASERQKTLKETEEQLAYQKRIHDALRRNDILTMSDRDFLNMLESETDKK